MPTSRTALRLALATCIALAGACKPFRLFLGRGVSVPPDPAQLLPDAHILVGAGDIGLCLLPGARATAELLDQIDGAIFTAGDNAYPDGSRDDFEKCYAPTWGRHRDRTRPTPGNHEYEHQDPSAYFDYFGAAAGERGKGYYSYDIGEWHLIAMNSNIDVAAGSPQEQWLRADLRAHPARCTLAYWHHAPFSSSDDANSASLALFTALFEAGADVVLAGHHHAYERFAPQRPDSTADSTRGIREFVVGTGGAGLDAFGKTAKNSELRYNANYGVLRLVLLPNEYTWSFISANGHIRDAGKGACH